MRFTILLPHYKTGKMTAAAVYKFLEHKGNHDIDLIIINNSYPDSSINYILDTPLADQVRVVNYPEGILQSHGIAFDYVVPDIETEYFITVESDSFPTKDNWLDYYENLINQGFDAAGSLLQLSGGQYMHPAGALYRKSIWEDAKEYVESVPYKYLPGAVLRENHAGHLMVRDDKFVEFCENPSAFDVELSGGYKQLSSEEIAKKAEEYKPACGPFHDGRGNLDESVRSYGQRSISKDPLNIRINDPKELIYRIGYEPGQFFCYYMLVTGRQLFYIPTEVQWMNKRTNEQQSYTLMENGFKHLWGVTAYSTVPDRSDLQDILDEKKNAEENLYNALPEEFKYKEKE